MKTIKMVGGALALALAACAHDMPRQAMAAGKPDWKVPNVYVSEGKYIVVDQDPIVVPKGARDKITWQLDPASGYKFPGDGIVFESAGTDFRCRLQAGGTRVVCDNDHSKPGKYKYTIKVLDPSGKQLDSDPYVVND